MTIFRRLIGAVAACALFAGSAFAQGVPVPAASGGGGGGAATIADGADVTQGSEADAANIAVGHTLMAAIRQLDADVVTLTSTAAAALAAQINPGVDIGATEPYVGNNVNGVTGAMTGTTTTSLIGAVSTKHIYITQLTCTNSHATVGTFVTVQDGSGGTQTFYEAYAAAVGGGFALSFPTPLKNPTAGNAVYVADVTTGANVICAASGFSGS